MCIVIVRIKREFTSSTVPILDEWVSSIRSRCSEVNPFLLCYIPELKIQACGLLDSLAMWLVSGMNIHGLIVMDILMSFMRIYSTIRIITFRRCREKRSTPWVKNMTLGQLCTTLGTHLAEGLSWTQSYQNWTNRLI